MNKATRAALLASTALPMLAGTPASSHAQQVQRGVPSQVLDSLLATTKSEQEKAIFGIILQNLVWRGDSVVIDAAAAAKLAEVPDSLMSAPAFGKSQIIQLAATSSELLSHIHSTEVPVVIEPGAPLVIVNNNLVTDRSFILHLSKVNWIAALKGDAASVAAYGERAKSGVFVISETP